MKLKGIQYTRLCKGFVASIVMLGLGANVSQAQQSPQFISIHGSACQPANLGQSINFQTSWHQSGVRNVNALGSGRNFFVVCPVVVTDDLGPLSAGTPSDIGVHLRYPDRSANVALRVRCTGRRQAAQAAGFVKSVSATDPTAGTGESNVFLEITDLHSPADRAFSALFESASVVCSLVPQSGIGGISFDHD